MSPFKRILAEGVYAWPPNYYWWEIFDFALKVSFLITVILACITLVLLIIRMNF